MNIAFLLQWHQLVLGMYCTVMTIFKMAGPALCLQCLMVSKGFQYNQCGVQGDDIVPKCILSQTNWSYVECAGQTSNATYRALSLLITTLYQIP